MQGLIEFHAICDWVCRFEIGKILRCNSNFLKGLCEKLIFAAEVNYTNVNVFKVFYFMKNRVVAISFQFRAFQIIST